MKVTSYVKESLHSRGLRDYKRQAECQALSSISEESPMSGRSSYTAGCMHIQEMLRHLAVTLAAHSASAQSSPSPTTTATTSQ